MSANDKLAQALREIQIVAVDADLRATYHRTALEIISRKAREALAENDAALHQSKEAVARVERHTGLLKDMAIIVWLGEQPPVGTLLYAGSSPSVAGSPVGELHIPEKGIEFPYWNDDAINKLDVGYYTLVAHVKETP